MTFKKLVPTLLLLFVSSTFLIGQCRINEILTTNHGSITSLYDDDGDSPDYIELFNVGNSSVDISNWKLANSNAVWEFPATTSIAAGGYLTVWASGKDRTSPQLHTNFKLSKNGEYLGLYDDQNDLVSDFGGDYPVQYDKLSYGYDASGNLSYFTTVTDNAPNGSGFSGKVATPTATMGRGFYTAAVNETLSCITPNASIRYSIDGSVVTSSSTLYTSGISISPSNTGIVTVRAKAFVSGFVASDEISFSYVFPDERFNGLAADGLAAIPAISLYTRRTGFSPNISIDPVTNERFITNIEMIETDILKPGFSVTSAIDYFGQSSLTFDKKSLRLYFDSKYGVSDLEYPVFDGYGQGHITPVEKFDKLELRGMSWDSWQGVDHYPTDYYITDRWWKDSRLDMGELNPHGRYVNVFLNGVYTGVYQLRERFDHQFYASYSDEPAESFEALRYESGSIRHTNGNGSVYNTLDQPAQTYQTSKDKVNSKALIQHALMMSLCEKSPEEEYRCIGSTDPNSESDYIIMHNDNDFMFKTEWGINTLDFGFKPTYNPGDLPFFEKYRIDSEFLQDIYEETSRHFCPGGAMTAIKVVERLNYWEDEINLPMYSESERWVGGSTNTNIPLTDIGIYEHWKTNMGDIKNRIGSMGALSPLYSAWFNEGFFAGCDLRPEVNVENQISELGSFDNYFIPATDPDGDAMTFSAISDASYGLPPGLSMDGPTGEISGTPTQVGIYQVKIKVEDSRGKWGCHYFTWEIIDLTPVPAGIVINEIMYHPDNSCLGLPIDVNTAAYIELTNTASQAIDMSRAAFTDGIDFQFPDGTVIQPGGFYVIAQQDDAFEIAYGFTPDAMYSGKLSNGGERLELSDAYGNIIDVLTYDDKNPWDEDPDGEGPSLELLNPTYDNADPLNWFRSDNSCGTPGAENSRVCDGIAAQIVINEINYNSDPAKDPGDWVELHNPTASLIDISGWTFYDNNNEYVFDVGTVIDAGGFLVLVENASMFTAVFPYLDPAEYIGDFAFNLSNNGERVSLFTAEKCLSDYVIYEDSAPWDDLPDGNGPTLSLMDPALDNALPASWQASSYIDAPNGTPGQPNIHGPCVALELNLFLEGAYNTTTGKMNIDLNTPKSLLPGMANNQTAGQPYSVAPWNYSGDEGAGWTDTDYPSTAVDWVLVGIRSDVSKSSEVAQVAGVLLADGSITFPGECLTTSQLPGSYYIVVEHRNHMTVMSLNKVSIDNTPKLSWDFTTANSYRVTGGSGAKEINTGVWGMFAGDCDQMADPVRSDINSQDKLLWTVENGMFNSYLSSDMNMDGDVSGSDRVLWTLNNGLFGSVLK